MTNIYIPSSILYPASEYGTFCRASEFSPVVHSGFSAAGQLITLVYRGMINDLTLWVKYINFVFESINTFFKVFVIVFDVSE